MPNAADSPPSTTISVPVTNDARVDSVNAITCATSAGDAKRPTGPATRQDIALDTGEAPGTIIVSAKDHMLDFIAGKGKAIRYRIGAPDAANQGSDTVTKL